jgi:hypothetical protein
MLETLQIQGRLYIFRPFEDVRCLPWTGNWEPAEVYEYWGVYLPPATSNEYACRSQGGRIHLRWRGTLYYIYCSCIPSRRASLVACIWKVDKCFRHD